MTFLFLFTAHEFLKPWHFVADSNSHVCLCIQAISRFGFDCQKSTKSRLAQVSCREWDEHT